MPLELRNERAAHSCNIQPRREFPLSFLLGAEATCCDGVWTRSAPNGLWNLKR
jgi:hypothetical protein